LKIAIAVDFNGILHVLRIYLAGYKAALVAQSENQSESYDYKICKTVWQCSAEDP